MRTIKAPHQLQLQLQKCCHLWTKAIRVFFLIQSMDKVSKLPQIALVVSVIASLWFPSNYMVGCVGRSLHASNEATGTSATILYFDQ